MKTNTICQAIAGLAASAVLALGFSQSASAFTLKYGNKGVVTGIEDLDISGTKYDVQFKYGSFNSVYKNVNVLEGERPTFWGKSSLGKIAAMEIKSALGKTFVLGNKSMLLVPIGGEESQVKVWRLQKKQGQKIRLINFSTSEITRPYAVFTEVSSPVVSTPEPGSTVAILAVAGTGLLATRKRKNAKK